MKEIVIATHHKHIDNGGITVSIVDRGPEDGIYLTIDGQYFGYPAVISSMRIDPACQLGSEWLEQVGLMLIKASNVLADIDWERRYNPKLLQCMHCGSKKTPEYAECCRQCGDTELIPMDPKSSKKTTKEAE